MLASCALIAGIGAIGRYAATSGMPPLQIVFLRVAFAFLTMLPLFALRGRELVRTEQIKTYLIRVSIGLCAMYLMFIALSYSPLGEVTAISFLAPLFATVFAVVLLGEVVRMRRWAATIVGFIGAMVIIRPGMIEITTGVWLSIGAAVGIGMTTMFIKRLTGGDDATKVVFISTALMTPVTLIPALFVWEWPEPELWFYLALFGPVATFGHVALARAFSAADASVVMSFDFARMPFAVLLGFMLFGEVVDVWTWVGAGIIFSAGLYIARREMTLKKPPPAPENLPG